MRMQYVYVVMVDESSRSAKIYPSCRLIITAGGGIWLHLPTMLLPMNGGEQLPILSLPVITNLSK